MGPYSPVVRAGEWIVCSGQIGLREGALVHGLDAQVRRAIANLEALLSGEGASLADVVKTTVFLVHMSDYSAMNQAYTEAFGGHRPARSAVVVTELPLGALVEVEAWAYAPSGTPLS